jgi:hypothetical protein
MNWSILPARLPARTQNFPIEASMTQARKASGSRPPALTNGKVQVFDKPGRYGTVSEVTVVHQTIFNPYYLAAFLRSKVGQYQIGRFITGATGQLHLYPRDVEKIFVPVHDNQQQSEFQTIAENVRQHRQRAREDSEAAAFRFLDEASVAQHNSD